MFGWRMQELTWIYSINIYIYIYILSAQHMYMYTCLVTNHTISGYTFFHP